MGRNQKSVRRVFNRFAAIDFETADYGRDSACSVSIVIVEKREIVKKEFALIRPPRRDFIFSYLHGITWKDVAKKHGFGKIWPEINKFLSKVEFIAAHNASFDRGVLHACCTMAGIVPPDVKYLCTMKLARCLWGLYPTRLPDVCRYFGILLKHHNADSDAIACAKIVLKALEEGIPVNAFLGKNTWV